MAKNTKIAWCDHTFNPWIGCTRVGPGCDHCYAEAMDARKRWHGGKTHWGPGVPRYRTSEANWRQPLAWNPEAEKDGQPHRVFCASLADVFDNEVPNQWRMDLFSLIADTPHLSWLLVTKRIGNVRTMCQHDSLMWDMLPYVRILITVCNQEEADRDIPKLLALPCKNGISYEPALGPVDWMPWLAHEHDGMPGCKEPCGICGVLTNGMHHPYANGIQWCIIGGESRSKARPFDLAWARSTVAQCKASGVPVFVKQVGRYPVPESDDFCGHRSKGHSCYRRWPSRYCDDDERVSVDLKDRAGADPSEWPEDLRVREFPE